MLPILTYVHQPLTSSNARTHTTVEVHSISPSCLILACHANVSVLHRHHIKYRFLAGHTNTVNWGYPKNNTDPYVLDIRTLLYQGKAHTSKCASTVAIENLNRKSKSALTRLISGPRVWPAASHKKRRPRAKPDVGGDIWHSDRKHTKIFAEGQQQQKNDTLRLDLHLQPSKCTA